MGSGEPLRDLDGGEWIRGPGGTLRRPCPTDCVGGYRPVSDLYAQSVSDDPLVQAAALRSVYPCETCQPEVHRLWSEGHMTPGHLASGGCDVCRPERRKARR